MNVVLAQIAPGDYWLRAVEFFSFQYGFATNALLASIVVGLTCGVVGTFLVLKGMSLIGDATGHATLPGVCVGFMLAGGAKIMSVLLLGAVVSGFAAAILVGVLSRGPRARTDAAIGVVLSVFFGLGIVLLSYIQNSPTGAQSGLDTFLFGNAAGVTVEQLWGLGAMGALVLLAIALFFRPLLLATFDRDFALATGVPLRAVEYGLLAALAVAVVVSIQAVGVVLVAAMLIIPASTALFLSKRMTRVTLLSGVLGASAGIFGAFVSYIFEGVSTGPAMVLVAGAQFALAFVFGPRGGLIRLGARALSRRAGKQEAAHV